MKVVEPGVATVGRSKKYCLICSPFLNVFLHVHSVNKCSVPNDILFVMFVLRLNLRVSYSVPISSTPVTF